MGAPFALNPSLDLARLEAEFAERGRLDIPDLLRVGDADRLRRHLLARNDWVLVLNAGESVYEIPRAAVTGLSPAQRSELDERVALAARDGFQYRYETIRVPDDDDARAAEDTPLNHFIRFLSSPPVLAALAIITGARDLALADGQATAYSAGHFLTRHDDDVVGKHRRAAYVLGLTPDWRAEWGGLLMFHRPDGNVDEAFTPAMGALRLFAVPSPHSVSYVTPFAPEPRLSITGWLRAAGGSQSIA